MGFSNLAVSSIRYLLQIAFDSRPWAFGISVSPTVYLRLDFRDAGGVHALDVSLPCPPTTVLCAIHQGLIQIDPREVVEVLRFRTHFHRCFNMFARLPRLVVEVADPTEIILVASRNLQAPVLEVAEFITFGRRLRLAEEFQMPMDKAEFSPCARDVAAALGDDQRQKETHPQQEIAGRHVAAVGGLLGRPPPIRR